MINEKLSKIIVRIKRYTLYMVYIVICILWILMLYSMVATGFEKGFSMPYILSVVVIWIIVSPFAYIAGICRDAYYEMGGLDPEEEMKKSQKRVIENGKKAIKFGTKVITRAAPEILHIVILGICFTIPILWFSTIITGYLMNVLISSEMMIYRDTVIITIGMISAVNIACFRSFLNKQDMKFNSSYRLFGDMLRPACVLGILYSFVLCISAVFSISNNVVSNELIYNPLILTIFTVVTYIMGGFMIRRFGGAST